MTTPPTPSMLPTVSWTPSASRSVKLIATLFNSSTPDVQLSVLSVRLKARSKSNVTDAFSFCTAVGLTTSLSSASGLTNICTGWMFWLASLPPVFSVLTPLILKLISPAKLSSVLSTISPLLIASSVTTHCLAVPWPPMKVTSAPCMVNLSSRPVMT